MGWFPPPPPVAKAPVAVALSIAENFAERFSTLTSGGCGSPRTRAAGTRPSRCCGQEGEGQGGQGEAEEDGRGQEEESSREVGQSGAKTIAETFLD